MMARAKALGFLVIVLLAAAASGQDREKYKSPYSVKFSFKQEELVGDLLKGPRADWKDYAAVPFAQWDNPANQERWSYRGPPAKHFNPPSGLSSKSPQWSRERVIAAGMKFIGYSYQHHHVPDWDPPKDWPRDPEQTTPPAKGLDCSNFTAFAYNLALGIKPTGDIKMQAAMTEVKGPGPNRTIPVRRIELPSALEDYEKTLLTGDLLYIKNSRGELSHVVLWVGDIGRSPDNSPLILDSTGDGNYDLTGREIPDGIYLRPFTPRSWYYRQASHALRIIPEDKK